MIPALFISDIVVDCTPPEKSRLKHVRVVAEKVPLILHDGKISEDSYWSTIRGLLYNKQKKTHLITDWSKYVITYKLSNTKFSSPLYIKK